MINNQIRLLEAILFASPDPMTPQQLHERMDEDCDIGLLLKELQNEYKDRGINLVNIENRWVFQTAPDLADGLKLEKNIEQKLSRAAMETLAVVAYHQPVTRPEIENIRGVSISSGSLDSLIEAGWIKPGRRRETLGRPVTWVTTPEFLEHFALESISDLPGMDELKASGLLDRRPAIETIPTSDDLFSEGENNATSDETDNEEEAIIL